MDTRTSKSPMRGSLSTAASSCASVPGARSWRRRGSSNVSLATIRPLRRGAIGGQSAGVPVHAQLDQALLLVGGDAAHFERLTRDLQLDAARRASAKPRLEDACERLENLRRLPQRYQQAAEHEQVATARPIRGFTFGDRNDRVDVQLEEPPTQLIRQCVDRLDIGIRLGGESQEDR